MNEERIDEILRAIRGLKCSIDEYNSHLIKREIARKENAARERVSQFPALIATQQHVGRRFPHGRRPGVEEPNRYVFAGVVTAVHLYGVDTLTRGAGYVCFRRVVGVFDGNNGTITQRHLWPNFKTHYGPPVVASRT